MRPLSAKSILPLQFYALSQVGINLKYGSFPIDGKLLVELLSLVSPRVLVRQHSTHYQKKAMAFRYEKQQTLSYQQTGVVYVQCLHTSKNKYLPTYCLYVFLLNVVISFLCATSSPVLLL